MPTLIFPDDKSGRAAERLQRKLDAAVRVPMALREADLHVFSQFELEPGDIEAVWQTSADLCDGLGRALPASLNRRTRPDIPAFWECYGEYFRSWAIAPLLANALIAKRAARHFEAETALIIENPRNSGWWTFRQQVLEAVRVSTRLRLKATPGTVPRALRRIVTTSPGAWLLGAAGMVRERTRGSRREWLSSLPDPAPADLLFLPIGRTSVPIIDRLSPYLCGSHGLSCAAVMFHAEDQGMEQRSTQGVPYQYVDNFSSPARHSLRALAGAPWWLRRACQQAPGAAWPPIWNGIRNRLSIALARDSQQLFCDIEAAGRILDVYKPKVLVALHLYWSRIAPIVLAAQARGIPVLYLQHGVYLAKDECIRPLPYDEFMVFGEAAAESLRPRVGDRPIITTGHCLYDEIASISREPSAFVDRLKGSASALIVLATQPDEANVYDVDSETWWVKGVAEAAKASGALLAIKLHPADVRTGMYEELQRRMPDTVRVVPAADCTITELLVGSDALVTRDSTVVFEANLLGVPAITVNLTGRADRFPFAADGGAAGVYHFADIRPTIHRILGASEEIGLGRPAFLARHSGPADGAATKRIAERILARLDVTL